MAERSEPVPFLDLSNDTCGSALVNLFEPETTAAVVTAIAPVFGSLARRLGQFLDETTELVCDPVFETCEEPEPE